MSANSDRVLGCLLLLVGYVLLVAIAVPLHAWTLTILWRWFVVPVFALPPLALWQAAGLKLVAGAIWWSSGRRRGKDDDDLAEFSRIALLTLLYPVFVLALGYVIRGLL